MGNDITKPLYTYTGDRSSRTIVKRGDRIWIWLPEQGGFYLTHDDLAAIAAVERSDDA